MPLTNTISVHIELQRYSDQQLRQELASREQLRKEAEENRKRQNSVTVVCPYCNGRGKTKEKDYASGYDYDAKCIVCDGVCKVTAQKVSQ